MRLNLGCGKDPLPGWVNIDRQTRPGVDRVMDLAVAKPFAMRYAADVVEEVYASHLLEHIPNPLHLLGDLGRVCMDGATATFVTPYGSSDDAWENPTHLRPIFPGTYRFFAQPTYWREESYGYSADWEIDAVELRLNEAQWARWGKTAEGFMVALDTCRNVVTEMAVTLRNIKPPRARDRGLMSGPVEARLAVLVPREDGRNWIVPAAEYNAGTREGGML